MQLAACSRLLLLFYSAAQHNNKMLLFHYCAVPMVNPFFFLNTRLRHNDISCLCALVFIFYFICPHLCLLRKRKKSGCGIKDRRWKEGEKRSEIESKSCLSGIWCVCVCMCARAFLCVHSTQRGKESFAYRTGSGSLTIALWRFSSSNVENC